MDKEKAEPDEELQVQVRADPQSFVGLLAVDQSVLLLESGKDISDEMVRKIIARFS